MRHPYSCIPRSPWTGYSSKPIRNPSWHPLSSLRCWSLPTHPPPQAQGGLIISYTCPACKPYLSDPWVRPRPHKHKTGRATPIPDPTERRDVVWDTQTEWQT